LRRPTQLPTHGQWWSILTQQRLHWLQWWTLGGLAQSHILQIKRYFLLSASNSSKERFTLILYSIFCIPAGDFNPFDEERISLW